MEHVVPIISGGMSDFGNVVPACLGCNSRKQDLPLETFLALLEEEIVGSRMMFMTRRGLGLFRLRTGLPFTPLPLPPLWDAEERAAG
jgi:HNH endonuclease